MNDARPVAHMNDAKPFAWAVYWYDEKKPILVQQNEKPSHLWNPQPRCVPLYEHTQPTLTDEERNAIAGASELLKGTKSGAALRNLLERTK